MKFTTLLVVWFALLSAVPAIAAESTSDKTGCGPVKMGLSDKKKDGDDVDEVEETTPATSKAGVANTATYVHTVTSTVTVDND